MPSVSDQVESSSQDKKLDQVFSEVLHLDQESCRKDTKTTDVAYWDSLKHMELVLAIEQKFGIELTFDEISEMQSTESIRSVLRKHKA